MPEQDQDVIDRIEQLAHEEHTLFEKESRGEATQSSAFRPTTSAAQPGGSGRASTSQAQKSTRSA